MNKLSVERLASSRSVQLETNTRVASMIARHNKYNQDDNRRREAAHALENGNTAALEDSIVPPTDELLASGQFEVFVADTRKNTVRTAATVRRVLCPYAVKFYQKGVIDEAGLYACRWYCDLHEFAELLGNIRSTDFSKEVFYTPSSRSNADWQEEAKSTFRFIRSCMTLRWLPFFDAVVLEDVAPQKALRLSRGSNGTEVAHFRDTVAELIIAYELNKSNNGAPA